MIRLILQYAAAAFAGALGAAGAVVADDLVTHQNIDIGLAIGKGLAAFLAFLPSIAFAAHLPDLGTAKAAAHIKARMRADDAVAIPGGPR